MAPVGEKSHQPIHCRQYFNNEMKSTSSINPYYFAPHEDDEISKINCSGCVRYWSFNFLINGMFTTSRIVGYSQFMVFMILRVIIAGSLCGRLYGNDPSTTNCSFLPQDGQRIWNAGTETFNRSSIDVKSNEVRSICLSKAYWNVNPTALWAVGLLTVILPWLFLLPWTPLREGQDYVICRSTNRQWPCLTIYVVRFMKACFRLLLEFMCVISVPILYGLGIPNTVTCFQSNVICMIQNAKEKTYFLWLFLLVNLISLGLTVWELVDICRNKHFYENGSVGYASASKISSNRSSTATINNSQYAYKREPSEMERGRPNLRGNASQVALRAASSKRRLGSNRCDNQDRVQPRENKFRGRRLRQSECDEIIKLASRKQDEKSELSSPSFLTVPSSVLGGISAQTERKSELFPHSLTIPTAVVQDGNSAQMKKNDVILHDTGSDCEIHIRDESTA